MQIWFHSEYTHLLGQPKGQRRLLTCPRRSLNGPATKQGTLTPRRAPGQYPKWKIQEAENTILHFATAPMASYAIAPAEQATRAGESVGFR